MLFVYDIHSTIFLSLFNLVFKCVSSAFHSLPQQIQRLIYRLLRGVSWVLWSNHTGYRIEWAGGTWAP